MNRVNEICEEELGPVEAAERIAELEAAAQLIVTRWDETVKLIHECGREPAWAEAFLCRRVKSKDSAPS